MTSPKRLVTSLALALALAAGSASPANADAYVMKRAVSNIICAPLDLVLSPVVAGKTMVDNLKNIGDSKAVRYFYPPFGYLWLTGVQVGASVLRGISGALEMVPAVILLPFDATISPLFSPVERANALVDKDTVPLHFKFGIDYTTPPS